MLCECGQHRQGSRCARSGDLVLEVSDFALCVDAAWATGVRAQATLWIESVPAERYLMEERVTILRCECAATRKAVKFFGGVFPLSKGVTS